MRCYPVVDGNPDAARSAARSYQKSETRVPKSKNNNVSKEAGHGAERLGTRNPACAGKVPPSFLARRYEIIAKFMTDNYSITLLG